MPHDHINHIDAMMPIYLHLFLLSFLILHKSDFLRKKLKPSTENVSIIPQKNPFNFLYGIIRELSLKSEPFRSLYEL